MTHPAESGARTGPAAPSSAKAAQPILPQLRTGHGPAADLLGWLGLALTFASLLRALRRLLAVHILTFDDAYMFYRYALHLRSGLGISWNLDAVPTYGLTSLTWLATITPLTWLPLPPATLLPRASFALGLAALAVMVLAVVTAARGPLRRPVYAIPLIALPLLPHQDFFLNATNGMDTMLALAVTALVVWQAWRWMTPDPGAGLDLNRSAPSKSAPVLGILAFLAFYTRPETALCAFLVPLLLWLFRAGRFQARRSLTDLLPPLLLGSILIAAGLAAARFYFKTALPLSFYMKSGHAYAGYGGSWPPLYSLYSFAVMAQFFLALQLFAVHRSQLPTLAAFYLPVLLAFAYLGTVQQIMGFPARYYLPFLPFLAVPALWSLDRLLAAPPPPRAMALRAALCLPLLFPWGAAPLTHLAVRYRDAEKAKRLVYPPPLLQTAAGCILPDTGWFPSVQSFSEDLLPALTPGSTVAASEVGYPGAMHPEINILDEVGLNDPAIAFQGFTPDRLLNRRPDLIWMPHPAYTAIYGSLLAAPRLYREYTVYAGALRQGVALRKDSPAYPALRRAMQKLYLGRNPADFIVTAAHWTPILQRQGELQPTQPACP